MPSAVCILFESLDNLGAPDPELKREIGSPVLHRRPFCPLPGICLAHNRRPDHENKERPCDRRTQHDG